MPRQERENKQQLQEELKFLVQDIPDLSGYSNDLTDLSEENLTILLNSYISLLVGKYKVSYSEKVMNEIRNRVDAEFMQREEEAKVLHLRKIEKAHRIIEVLHSLGSLSLVPFLKFFDSLSIENLEKPIDINNELY